MTAAAESARKRSTFRFGPFTAHSMDMRDDVALLAEQQNGAVSRSDLLGLGLGRGQIDGLIRRGAIRRAAPSVFVVRGAPHTHHQRLRIGLLALGPESWVSFEAAAALHGLDRSRRGVVEFTTLRSGRRRSLDVQVHSTQRMPKIDRVVVDGFRVTSATRTILDLALARSPVPRLEAAIDSAVRLQLSSPATIERRLATLRGSGRWGVRAVESLLPDTGGHSMLERRFLELVRTSGLPRPRTQVVHRRGRRTVARVDFFFEEQGVVIEVDGRRGHSSDAERAKDSQRRGELLDLGLRVFEHTWTDITERPATVVHLLRQRLDLPFAG